ncbi:hypothetical protein [Candidatus Tisiphia endosymbiont of Sialis lutaria]|uniref:hypothetical protein n=1 Tax=Candidatus Tisiphia endosymbiont of Sialis lutaria TaxID=2029164 RepID=UPI00312CA931
MSYFLQPKRVKYRITLVIVGSLLEVTTSPTSPELTITISKAYSGCYIRISWQKLVVLTIKFTIINYLESFVTNQNKF